MSPTTVLVQLGVNTEAWEIFFLEDAMLHFPSNGHLSTHILVSRASRLDAGHRSKSLR